MRRRRSRLQWLTSAANDALQRLTSAHRRTLDASTVTEDGGDMDGVTVAVRPRATRKLNEVPRAVITGRIRNTRISYGSSSPVPLDPGPRPGGSFNPPWATTRFLRTNGSRRLIAGPVTPGQ